MAGLNTMRTDDKLIRKIPVNMILNAKYNETFMEFNSVNTYKQFE